jgi:hypothetical protein
MSIWCRSYSATARLTRLPSPLPAPHRRPHHRRRRCPRPVPCFFPSVLTSPSMHSLPLAQGVTDTVLSFHKLALGRIKEGPDRRLIPAGALHPPLTRPHDVYLSGSLFSFSVHMLTLALYITHVCSQLLFFSACNFFPAPRPAPFLDLALYLQALKCPHKNFAEGRCKKLLRERVSG